ncbi:disintegrin and metalloproteinase domain-containing protein 10-like [Haemaphysalis longicornis]
MWKASSVLPVRCDATTSSQSLDFMSAGQRLSRFVRRYEPLYYDPEPVHRSHVRAKRAIGAGGGGDVHVRLRSSNRVYDLRLSSDKSVFHEDLIVESSAAGVINADTSHIYSGSVVGEPHSRVFGAIQSGIFEGSIKIGSSDTLYVERASHYFNESQPFHSVLYSVADLHFPAADQGSGQGRWCGLHGKTERWMRDVLHKFRRPLHAALSQDGQLPIHVGRKLQAAPAFGSTDTDDDADNHTPFKSLAPKTKVSGRKERSTRRHALEGSGKERRSEEGSSDEPEDADPTDSSYSDEEGEESSYFQGQRRSPSLSRRVCNMKITVDHTLFEFTFNMTGSKPETRAWILSAISRLVEKANEIYGRTNFGGIEDMRFLVQHIVIEELDVCVGSNRDSNKYCSSALDAPYVLYLLSLERHDDFCLSYRLNYRDFQDGTLGLAWIAMADDPGRAHRTVGSGGLCEKYRTAVEMDPSTSKYVQTKLSLNTGIVTFLNHMHFVSVPMASLTFAHELGHSLGSPHDDGPVCNPMASEDGKYLMYEASTDGDKRNNDKFSPCSISNITGILLPLTTGDTNRENCLLRYSGPICGNLIVEGDEECDCGVDDIECTDTCCYPRKAEEDGRPCTLREHADCSPTAGACCTEDCKVVKAKQLCGEPTECALSSYCDGVKGTCPKPAPRPNLTACNKNTQVCLSGECGGSICTKYGLRECFRSGSDLSLEQKCLLTCKKPGTEDCKEACAFPEMASHCGAKLQPGSPCDDMRGYCDVFHKCRIVKPQGFLSRLQLFFGGEGLGQIVEFMAHHPVAAIVVILGSSWFMVLIFRCFAIHTPSTNPLKKPPFKLIDTLRNPANYFER